MSTKKVFPTELAYLLGLLILAAGTALMERADFGLSMVVAPAYLLHLRVSRILPFFTFGMAEYVFQAFLLLLLSLVLRRFRKGYLFSFVTAVLYGLILDFCMKPAAFLPAHSAALRLVWYASGLLMGALGVSLLFHTYITPEAYELVVKETSSFFQFPVGRVKTAYDCISCLIAVLMSFAFFGFGHFEGVKTGTIVCALINGWLIHRFGSWLEHGFIFRDALPFREFFQGENPGPENKQA